MIYRVCKYRSVGMIKIKTPFLCLQTIRLLCVMLNGKGENFQFEFCLEMSVKLALNLYVFCSKVDVRRHLQRVSCPEHCLSLRFT
jgi:hypothetical protein